MLVAARPIAQWPGEKKSEVRDHAAVQALVFQRAEAGTSLAGGALFGLGVLGFDVAVLATFGLPPGACQRFSSRWQSGC